MISMDDIDIQMACDSRCWVTIERLIDEAYKAAIGSGIRDRMLDGHYRHLKDLAQYIETLVDGPRKSLMITTLNQSAQSFYCRIQLLEQDQALWIATIRLKRELVKSCKHHFANIRQLIGRRRR